MGAPVLSAKVLSYLTAAAAVASTSSSIVQTVGSRNQKRKTNSIAAKSAEDTKNLLKSQEEAVSKKETQVEAEALDLRKQQNSRLRASRSRRFARRGLLSGFETGTRKTLG